MQHKHGLHGYDLAIVLFICVVWGINFLTSAYALREIPPILFTATRLLILACVLGVFVRRPKSAQWLRLIAVALSIGVMHFGLSFFALHLAGNISSPAIVMQSYIPMAVLLAWWWLGERFSWHIGLAISLSFLGVLILGFDPIVLNNPVALLLMIAAALFLAIGTVLMRPLTGLSMASQQGWIAIISVLPLLLLSYILEPNGLEALQNASWIGWAGLVYSACVASLFGHGLYYVLLQRHPVVVITPWLLLAPVLAMTLGILFWGDKPGPRFLIGGVMVLSGVLAIALRTRTRLLTPTEDI